MARFSDDELDRIKKETDIVALIESYGTKLKQRPDGHEYLGCCPLHDDSTPSLFVNKPKGLWQCKGQCGCGGDVFKWIERAEKVSFRHAVELLQSKSVGVLASNGTKAAFVRRLESPIDGSVEDHQLLAQVSDYYHSRLSQSPDAIAYLQSRGLDNAEAIAKFKIGFCDRTLGLRLPNNQHKAGKEIRSRLESLGILKQTGHEAMRGSITFPILLGENNVGEIYGRRIMKGTPPNERHWYLSGPHVGVWNAEAFQCSNEIILCESIIDALTFWIAGYRNVTTSYGNQGFTDELYQAFIEHDVKICWIAWDNDEKSNPLALKLAERLMAQGIKCMRIKFPSNAKDANEFASKLKDGNGSAHGSLSMLMRSAEWFLPSNMPLTSVAKVKQESAQASSIRSELGPHKEQRPSTTLDVDAKKTSAASNQTLEAPTKPVAEPETRDRQLIESNSTTQPKLFLLGAGVDVAKPETSEVPSKPVANAGSSLPAKTIDAEVKENEISITIGNRSYRIRGLSKNGTSYDSMKVNVLVRKGEAFFVDTLDIYAARSRNLFIKETSRELSLEEEIIKRDLGKILLKLEELQDKQALAIDAANAKKIEITDPDKAKALELLKSDRLAERILADFEACGVVGEETNKLFGYIAATSRKLDRPLAVMVQSSSAAGKSSLMDAVLGFIPPEEQITYSAMTGQSLFYMGGMELKNKILAISEEEGVRQAAYALKLLQSEGQLTIASTGKDPGTGRMETQDYHVEGPVMIFLTTTAIDVDPELLNRCTVLTVNEDREQTAAIHRQQRREETLEGLQTHHRKGTLRRVHHNAQRLLRPLDVVNPYAEDLRFLDNQTRFRRDHKKYLTLIRAVALLHQYQRPIKTTTIEGEVREYIEVTASDIVLANRLADAVLGRSIDELPPQTRRLLWQLTDFVREETESKDILQNEVRFLRRDIRERFSWGQTQLKLHLDRLLEMEYVLAHRTATRTIEYELLFDGRGREGQPTLPGLIDPTKCNPSTSTISSSGASEPTSAPMMPISGATLETSGPDRAIIAVSSNELETRIPQQNLGGSDLNPQIH